MTMNSKPRFTVEPKPKPRFSKHALSLMRPGENIPDYVSLIPDDIPVPPPRGVEWAIEIARRFER